MLVVWRLERLGRSLAHLVTLIEGLRQRQVGFRSLGDGAIDTTTASGELVFHIFSALAQFERASPKNRRNFWRQGITLYSTNACRHPQKTND